MTQAAQERLDNVTLLEAGDPSGMLRQVASAAAQVREGARVAHEADLGAVSAGGRPRAIVVTGMGGSGIAGEVLAAVAGMGCPVLVTTVHDYRLPGWVGAADLVIAVSCSGATEETLSAAGEAVRRGCRLLAVGSADSPLAALAEQARASFIPVKPVGMPRAMLWGLSVPLVVVAGWGFSTCQRRRTRRPRPNWSGSRICAGPTARRSSTRRRCSLWSWPGRCR